MKRKLLVAIVAAPLLVASAVVASGFVDAYTLQRDAQRIAQTYDREQIRTALMAVNATLGHVATRLEAQPGNPELVSAAREELRNREKWTRALALREAGR